MASSGGGDSSCGYLIFCLVDAVTERAKGSLEARFECVCEGVTLDRWIPLNGTRYHFEQRLVPEVEDVAANSKPRLRVLSKYVPGPVAVLESELDRTFHCQDFLILALQSLSATAVGPGTGTSGGGGRGLGTASELDLDMQPEQFGTSTCTSNGAGEGKISMHPMALERVALSTKTNAASVTSSPSLASSTCGAQAVRFGTVAGGPPGSATVPTGAPFLFVSDAGNSSGMSGVFRSHKEFEDACWERIRPYHQIIDLLESRVETSAFEREDVEIYKKAAAALRVQSVGLQEKFREATTHFERRVAEYAKTVEMKTAEVNSLRGQLHEVRASRDAALDEMTMHKNSLAMDETEKVEQAVLLKQVKSLESLLKEKKDFFQNLEVRRAEEKQTYRENEEKLRDQLDGLSAELERVEAEKARTALRLQENLNLTLMTLESENRELRSSKTLLADLRSQVSRQEEQLRTRSQQLEDIRYNFELQQKQEVEQQQRLIHEKQEAVEELRKYQRGGQGGAYNSKPPSPSDILSSSAGAGASGAGRNNPHDASLATHNLRSLEQEISMQTAQRVELEQRLKLAVDAEKHKEQIEKFCKDLEERVAVLVREKEAQEASFAEHLSNEKARVELLEKDNTDLKGLLQEIQPEFHKAQTELEKARFQVKDAEARALINEEQQRLAAKVKEELVDLEQECVALRKSHDHLQHEYVERSSRLWDDYQNCPPSQYLHSLPNSTNHMQLPDNKDNYRYIPARGDSIDKALAQLINKVRPPVPFYRLSQGIYLYGSKKVLVKLTKQNKLIFRVGGGYCSFHEFLEQFEGGGNSAIVD
eukprot:g3434.t1